MNLDIAVGLVLGLCVAVLVLLVVFSDLIPDGVRWVWRRLTGRT